MNWRSAPDPGATGVLEPYDAVVLGGVAYMFHWLKDASAFARRHDDELLRRPVWIFSSGPLGTDLVDDEGQDARVSARPKEFTELSQQLRPRGERVFFGAFDPDAPPIGIANASSGHTPAAKDAMPAGDFRDFDDIDAWAAGIAAELEEWAERCLDLMWGRHGAGPRVRARQAPEQVPRDAPARR